MLITLVFKGKAKRPLHGQCVCNRESKKEDIKGKRIVNLL